MILNEIKTFPALTEEAKKVLSHLFGVPPDKWESVTVIISARAQLADNHRSRVKCELVSNTPITWELNHDRWL